MPSLLELDSIIKDFPGVRALDGVSLRLNAGEIHALCGENGAGKSTLLKIMAGCYGHGSYQGAMRLDGVELALSSPREAEERGIALVAQELNLVPALSVAENMFLGREKGNRIRVDWPETQREAMESMAKVGLDEDPSRPVEQLSVGKQQLIEIARALSKKARVLILDEPTAALTETDAALLLKLVKDIASQGTAVLYVSHRLEEVFQIAHSITVLRDGKSVRSGPASGWTRASVVADMVGRDLAAAEASVPVPAPSGKTALKVRHWSVPRPGLPGFFALKDLSLHVEQGEILGIGGLMGSGRTALLSTLFGDLRSSCSGELSMDGATWRGAFSDPGQAIAQGLCLVSEDRKKMGLVPGSSVAENLALASLGEFKGALGLLDWEKLESAAQTQATALRVRAASLQVAANTLSGGNQQKVVLARWLLTGPKVLLLDEPTRGIDVGARAEIYRLIRDLAAGGLAVILASSDLPELLALSHRILVLSEGRLSAELGPSQFSPEAVMHAATS
ncbi:MAG: sugar ABC transporter ATP-binding protein [candidate division FCPU426 bacterium]